MRHWSPAALIVVFAQLTLASNVVAVPVTVRNPEPALRKAAPVTFGFPAPVGRLKESSAIVVRDSGGRTLPIQTRKLSQWPDGSLRWVLVDTQLDVPGNGSVSLDVSIANPVVPAVTVSPMRVTDRTDRIEVDTGVARFEVPKKKAGFLEQLRSGDHLGVGRLTSSIDLGEGRVTARIPRQVTILENGPLRVRIQLDGDYGNGVAYVVRLEAYSGHGHLRVFHTFVNKRDEPTVQLRSLSMDLPLTTGGDATYVVSTDGTAAALTGPIAAQPYRIVQIDNETIREGERERAMKLGGNVEITARGGRVGIDARWLWQEYPKGFEVSRSGIRYDLWPSVASPAKVGMGAAKTHEFTLWVTSASGGQEIGNTDGLGAAVDPEWIAGSGALSNALSAVGSKTFVERAGAAVERYRSRNDTERWDDRGEVRCDPTVPDRPRRGAYGMWNWGDWNFKEYHDDTKGCDSWGNLEYDTTQVLALTFAATGDPRTFADMVAHARHFMDVDRVHSHSSNRNWAGMNHPKNPLHFSFELGGVDLGHTWTEGLLSYFYLTGDERGLKAAREIADYLVRRAPSARRGNARQWGWPSIALLAVYDAIGDARYKSTALDYAKRGMRSLPADRKGDWKEGILADALAYTHAATGDAEIRDWLIDYAHDVVREKREDSRYYPAVAYVASLTGDAELRAAALAVADRLDLGNWGKPLSIAGRTGFRIHALLSVSRPQ